MGLIEQCVLFLSLVFFVADLRQSTRTNADQQALTNSNEDGNCMLNYSTVGPGFRRTGNCTSFSLQYVRIMEPSKELFASISDGVDSLYMTEVDVESIDFPRNLRKLQLVGSVISTKISIDQNATYKLESIVMMDVPQLPADIRNLRSLKYFDCRNIFAEVFDLSMLSDMAQLVKIYIDSNIGVTVSDSMQLPALQRLTIENSPVSLSDSASCAFPQLESLYLNDNHLTVIPKQFSKFNNLKYFSIIRNELRRVTLDAFADMKQLEILELIDSQIAELTTSNKLELPQLRALRLENNKLTELDATLWVMPALVRFDVGRNQLKRVSGLLTLVNANLHEVYLTDNPWDCEWLVETVMKMPGMEIFTTAKSCYARSMD